MRPDNEINNSDKALNIDPYKLHACLNGHLVLKLVKPALFPTPSSTLLLPPSTSEPLAVVDDYV
ncbi:hypothetical protein PGT21_028933 [Puccinia graminis f. sp. tritici]|uniref:Uncharacterized protein n=1 Tax=Puccinia graminis f. sp. tritici TaxID=56615 RepID=A0A5B0QC14_PUCGR|nr:hypothetical protein PGT21_028933 [Puccinia graminis f. sp. tritici]